MPAYFSDFNAVAAHLEGMSPFHMDLSLSRMRHALERLGLRRPPFRVAQVLGSNGKGSTSTFLASICAAHGCQCGLYTSPHFVSIRERIRINGRPADEADWTYAANALMAAAPRAGLTYFEFLTMLALIIFARHGVDAAILEAGLGGRHDATTALAADLVCFTPIAMDHAAVLGNSLAEIASDKAYAIRSGAPVFSAPQFPAARRALELRAGAMGATLSFARPLPEDHARPRLLAGPHQDANAGLALLCWRSLAPLLNAPANDRARQAAGISGAFIPGRMQRIGAGGASPALILDGAHNPHAVKALARALAEGPAPEAPDAVIFSCLADKDWRNGLRILRRAWPGAQFLLPALANERAEDPARVAQFLDGLGGPPALAPGGENTLAQALGMASSYARKGPGLALVTGSLYLLADFYALNPQYLLSPESGDARPESVMTLAAKL